MNIPEELREIVISDPEIVSGALCFRGTRVPLEIFLDHIQVGISLERFLDGFPSVAEAQARAVLDWVSAQSRRMLELERAA